VQDALAQHEAAGRDGRGLASACDRR
jgi:hypothetical protein